MEPVTEGWLMREFTTRAKECQLQVDCLGSGKLDSEIAIISEAPSEYEAKLRMPVSGTGPKLMWTILRELGIGRKDCYVTNVVKKEVSLSSKEGAKTPVTKPELEHWEGLLDWELDHLPNLKYILCLGNFTLHALTGDTGISKWRGSVFDCKVGRDRRTVKVICTNNPAHVSRMASMELMFRFDVAKLKRVIDGKFTNPSILF